MAAGYPAYQGVPAYYPPAYPLLQPPPPYLQAPPRSSKPTAAGVLWIFVLIRDLFFLLIVSIWWLESAAFGFNPDFPFGLIDEPWVLTAIAAAGFGASAVALVLDFTRTRHSLGTVAGAAATAACVTPGLLFGFGIIGVALSGVALLLHLVSKGEFKPSPDAAAYAAYAQA